MVITTLAYLEVYCMYGHAIVSEIFKIVHGYYDLKGVLSYSQVHIVQQRP